ncbi:hypothetical protein CCP4SC76_1240005 [Gammaproteobacteria bacterium]
MFSTSPSFSTDQLLLLAGIIVTLYPIVAGRGGTFGKVILQPLPLQSKLALATFGIVIMVMSVSSQLYRSEITFDPPILDGRRIDICLYDKGIACGFEAATGWCRLQGYKLSPVWSVDSEVGKTILLGSRKECSFEKCSAFRTITCMR